MKAQDAIRKATDYVGVKEFPPNSNNVIFNTWYYHTTVSGSGFPWCAVFISFIFAGTKLCLKTASCLKMLEWFEARKQIVKTPAVGDIVFYKFSGNNRRTNHVGIVAGVKKDGSIIAIEGNTSTGNDCNGGCVMYRERSLKNVVAFARPNYGV